MRRGCLSASNSAGRHKPVALPCTEGPDVGLVCLVLVPLLLTLTDESVTSFEVMASKICLMALGMIPASLDMLLPSTLLRGPPSIVYVFPVPVWPYAKMVQLKPSSTSVTIGEMACWYTRSC